MGVYRVVIVDDDGKIISETAISAATPQRAAETVLGVQLIRGGHGHTRKLRAKVYFQTPDDLTMVRFYQPAKGPSLVKG